MARFRDIKTVSIFGTAWTGVTEVNCPLEAESFEYSADDDSQIGRVDITKLNVNMSINVQDPQKKRDIRNAVWNVRAFTVTALTDLVNLTAHGFEAGDILRLFSTSALPAPLAANTDYYVIAAGLTADVFSVSTTLAGAAVDITDTGTGTHTLGQRFGEVLSASISESGEEITDSADDDIWLKYLGMTKGKIEAEIEVRDIAQVLNAAKISIGSLGTFQFDVMPENAASGFYHATAYERFTLYNMVIKGVGGSNKHGALASSTVSMIGYKAGGHDAEINNTPSDAVPTGFEKHLGDSGTISFVAPSATGGADATITITGAVLTKAEIKAQHGGRLERSFSFKAVSTDGQTSPLAIS